MRFSPKTVGVLAAVVTVAIWTSFIVIARATAHRGLTPLDICLLRFAGAALVLLPWGAWLVWKRARDSAPGLAPPSWLGLSPLGFKLTALIGLVGGIAYACLAYSGFYFAPAAHASVLLPGTLPLSTTLMAVLILKDRVTPVRAIGLGLIFLGDVLVGGASLLRAWLEPGSEVWKGDLLFLGASTCWAVYSVLVRKHALQAVQATIAISVFAFVTYVPVYGLLVFSGALATQLTTAPWSEIIFQVVFQGMGSVVISGITFTKMVQHFGPVRSTMITAVVPGLSALGAVMFLGEPLHWNLLAGLALVTVGIVFGVRMQAQRPPAVAPDLIAGDARSTRAKA
ncbi:DMT family transporter [Polaromonas eurypsychrophila]|uniref:Membrane protein n=1 Tax=Polaromonas eurypsychrophila TaxID=1614635 RepID=A0A916S9U4_9BURK|nr:DMT family transporter [Polaromonas eurypsychrophila]GGA88894.1 membrane protein [Polaromonas eurypsychrophila]